MPHDEILFKLEETDPALVDDVRGNDAFHDIEDDYDAYARGEIVDWTPDDVYLESDHPRRDPALSRSMINLRYADGRGPNDYRLPQHPELFLGFTGNDPRGRDTQPRLDRARAQMAARGREREVRMGHNVGHGEFIESDRPWGGMAQEYDKKELQRRLKSYYQWFPAQKLGRPWGRNTVADEYYGLRSREQVVGDGSEGLYVPEEDQPGPPGPLFYGQATGHDPAVGATSGGVRRADASTRDPRTSTAPWRNCAENGGDTELPVQRYTDRAQHGREHFGAQGTGGALAGQAGADGDFGGQTQGRSANRRVLAEGMSAAATHRRALARAGGGDADPGRSAEVPRALWAGRTAPRLARDIALAVQMGRPDQPARAPGTVQDHEGGGLGGAAGLGPPADRQAALHQGEAAHAPPPNIRLGNAAAMVRGLREGTAAEFRSVQGQAVAAGPLGSAVGEAGMAKTAGLVPAAGAVDVGAAAAAAEAPLVRAAAADALEVHNYGMAVPGDPAVPVAAAQAGGFASPGEAKPGRREGRSKGPEFRSHTQLPTALGGHPSLTPGPEGVAPTGALSVGEKNVRASTLADRGDDVLGRFADGLGDAMDD